MRDLLLFLMLMLFAAGGLKRPFVFVMGFVYIDTLAPQYLAHGFVRAVPWSALFAALSLGGWLLLDNKRGVRPSFRQILLIALLFYCWATLPFSDVPDAAHAKWSWVWKTMAFAIFLPLTLTSRLRVEAVLLIQALAAATIIIVGGIKTLASGGGYGALNLLVNNNTGLFESSIISMAAIALIPVILWLSRHSLIFPRNRWGQMFAWGLVGACLLIPIGTEARTGLVCAGLIAVMKLRDARHRMALVTAAAAMAIVAIPFLPDSFTRRMDTIKTHKADSSAATRIAVWRWTLDLVREQPQGGGFDSYRQNRLWIELEDSSGEGANQTVRRTMIFDQARAFHSSYFEVLGEQGIPGLILWLTLHLTGLVQMERIRRKTTGDPSRAWAHDLATALQQAQIVYLAGSAFVGIAFQPFIFLLLAAQMGLAAVVRPTDQAPEYRAGAPVGAGWRPQSG